MSVTDHPGLTNRMINDPGSIDVADSEIWQTKIYVPQGVTQAVDTGKIKHWDKILHLAAPDDAARIAIAQTGVAVLSSFLAFLRTPLPPADEPVETEETN